MLPDINTDDRGVSQEGVLVSGGGDLKTLGDGVNALEPRYVKNRAGSNGIEDVRASPILNLG